MDRDESVGNGNVDGLTGKPDPDRVELAGKADLAGRAHTTRRGRLV